MVTRIGLDSSRHLVAVHARHHDVEQDQVRRLRCDHGERFFAAGGGLEEEALRREHDLQQLPVLALVVHDQDARSTPHALPAIVRLWARSLMLGASCAATVARNSW